MAPTPLPPDGITIIRFPEEAELLEVAHRAAELGLHLITNGQRIVMARAIPAGWTKVAVRTKAAA